MLNIISRSLSVLRIDDTWLDQNSGSKVSIDKHASVHNNDFLIIMQIMQKISAACNALFILKFFTQINLTEKITPALSFTLRCGKDEISVEDEVVD